MEIQLKSFAKINLHLKVLFERPDGYHEVRTLFQSVSLADDITISPRGDDRIAIECDHPAVPLDERNLCVRAARSLQEFSKCHRGAWIHLAKQIPIQGGMGGGSSNAAAVLAGLNQLWSLDRPDWELAEIGQALGADVPFFLLGGTAAGVGRGDEVFPLPDLPVRAVLLVCPTVTVSTAWAYARLSFLLTEPDRSNKIAGLSRMFFNAAAILHLGENDFEKVVFSEFPLLRQIKDQLLEAGAEKAMLSGSGAVVFGIFDSEASCAAGAAYLAPRFTSGRIIPARFVTRAEHRQGLQMHPE